MDAPPWPSRCTPPGTAVSTVSASTFEADRLGLLSGIVCPFLAACAKRGLSLRLPSYRGFPRISAYLRCEPLTPSASRRLLAHSFRRPFCQRLHFFTDVRIAPARRQRLRIGRQSIHAEFGCGSFSPSRCSLQFFGGSPSCPLCVGPSDLRFRST